MKVNFNIKPDLLREICQGEIIHYNPSSQIKTISTDSRDLGEHNLFIPLLGANFDGHNFIKELVDAHKIDCFLTMKTGYEKLAQDNDVTAIRCQDSLKSLGALGAWQRKKINPKIVAITGTNGKSTVKELTHAILEQKDATLKNDKNYNNEIGVPFTLLKLNFSFKTAVIEMGMNHSGEIERLSEMVQPDLAVITSVGAGHLEFLSDIKQVALAKAEIVKGLKPGSTLLVNKNIDFFDLIKEQANQRNIKIKTFGLTPGADYYPERYYSGLEGIELTYQAKLFKVKLYGLHNLLNLITALAIAEELGVELGLAQQALEDFSNLKGRGEFINGACLVFDDTYNSNPLSAKQALRTIKNLYPQKRKIAVLGEMKELGPRASKFHFEIGEEVARNNFNLFFSWGEQADFFQQGALKGGLAQDQVYVFQEKEELIAFLLAKISSDDLVLVKGSRSTKMEDIVQAIVNKR